MHVILKQQFSVWIAHFMYDLVNFFAVYLPDRSQCYVVSMQGHKLFPREINYFPISIWKWSLHTEISFAHLQYSLKVRNWEKTWTRDGQFSSLVRFKTTSLNWISLVMKIDHPLFTFFPARVPFVSYCDVSKIHIFSPSIDQLSETNTQWSILGFHRPHPWREFCLII